MAIMLVVLVVLAGVGAYLYATGHLGGLPASNGGRLGSLPPSASHNSTPPRVTLNSIALAGENVTVSQVRLNGSKTIAAGSLVNMTATVAPACGTYGCVSELWGVNLPRGFLLAHSVPILPTGFSGSGAVAVTLQISVPLTPGNYSLDGTVVGGAPPGPVTLAGVQFSTTYSGWFSGFLTMGVVSVPSVATPNATFSLDLSASSNLSYPVVVSAVDLGAPFQVTSSIPSFPITIQPNGTTNFGLTVRAASPGNYSLSAAVNTSVARIVIITGVNYVITIVPDPFTALYPTFAGVPRYVLPGQVLTFTMSIFNGDSIPHGWQFNKVYAPFTLQSVSPIANFTKSIGAGTTGVWTITVVAPSTMQATALGVALTDES